MRHSKVLFVSILFFCIFTWSVRGGLVVDPPRHRVSLDGVWELTIDSDNIGKNERWFADNPPQTARSTTVPGALEETFPGYDGVVGIGRPFGWTSRPKRTSGFWSDLEQRTTLPKFGSTANAWANTRAARRRLRWTRQRRSNRRRTIGSSCV